MIYYAYFDESGTHAGSPLMAIAAYVFTKRNARLFSEKWDRQLKRWGLSHSHMTDCATGNGEYQKLSVSERVQTEKELISLIRKYSLSSVCISIDDQYYQKAMGEKPRIYSAYTYLLLLMVDRISRELRKKDPTSRVKYIFESGHANASEAHRFMCAIKVYGGEVGDNYANHAFMDKRQELPLQAADMLAWQFRHFSIRSKIPGSEPRKDFLALLRECDHYSEIKSSNIDWLAGLVASVDPENTLGPFDLLVKAYDYWSRSGLPL